MIMCDMLIGYSSICTGLADLYITGNHSISPQFQARQYTTSSPQLHKPPTEFPETIRKYALSHFALPIPHHKPHPHHRPPPRRHLPRCPRRQSSHPPKTQPLPQLRQSKPQRPARGQSGSPFQLRQVQLEASPHLR